MTDPATGAPKQTLTEDDTKSAAARVVASVLDLPGIAGVAEAMVEPLGKALLALAQPVDSIASEEGIANRLLGMAVSEAAQGEASVWEVIQRRSGASVEPDAPPPDPTPPPWPQIISDLFEELAEHVAAEDSELRREARAVLRELGSEITGLRALAVLPLGGNRPPAEIVARVEREIAKRAAKLQKVLNLLEKLFGKISTPRFRFALQLLEAELLGPAQRRAVIAAFLSVPGFLLDLAVEAGAKEAPSSLSIGTDVHYYLQAEYRRLWSLRGLIVQDGFVYYHAPLGVPLADAAESQRDGSLYALLFARLPERAIRQIIGKKAMDRVWSMYREDTLDMRCGEVWEIKPMRSAAIGVYQELQYRHAFNLVNALMLDVRDLMAAGPVKGLLRKRIAFFKGKYFSREVPLIGGLDANWISIKRAFVVRRGQGRPLLAVPMTVPQLPGLLLYVLLEVPAAALLVLSGVLAKTIADQLEKLARDYAKFVEEVLEVLARIALPFLAGVAIVVVAVLFWEALGIGAGAGALAALALLIARFAPALGASLVPAATSPTDATDPTGGGSPGGSGSLPKVLLEAAQRAKLKPLAPPRIVGNELIVQLEPIAQATGPRVPVIDVALGHVRVCGLPASARPIVDALAQIGAAIAAGAFAEFLGEQTPQA